MKSRHLLELSEISIPMDIQRLDSGDFLATSSVLKELLAQGRTIIETVEIAQDVARKLIESYQEHGDKLPASIQRQLNKKNKQFHFQIPVSVCLS